MVASPTTAVDESQYICTLSALHPLPSAKGFRIQLYNKK